MTAATHPATDRQRKLIDIFRIQLSLSNDDMDDLARQHGGDGMGTITRKVASAIITDLQRLKEERQRRNWA